MWPYLEQKIHEDQYRFEREKQLLKESHQEELNKKEHEFNEIQKVCHHQQHLLEQLCAQIRKNVTCKFCNKIFDEPVVLPCSNSICKSHLKDFNKNKCIFCEQIHTTLKSNEPQVNENLRQTIRLNYHLTENEKAVKKDIEELFETNKNLSEKLKKKEAETESFCFEHFSNIMNKIDLHKEELNSRDLGEKLISKVKEFKSNFLNELEANASKQTLIKYLEDLEVTFNEDLRKDLFITENFVELKLKLADNIVRMNKKMDFIIDIKAKIECCSNDINKYIAIEDLKLKL